MKKIIKIIMIIFILLLVLVVSFLFFGKSKPAENIYWGINFSQKHAQLLGLDWKETYLAILKDLGAKRIRTVAYWDLIEPKEGEFDFKDIDWQLEQAKESGAKVLLVTGMKVPRWPECFIPEWAKGMNKEEQQEKILQMLDTVVRHYVDFDVIWGWQVENEPFFPFGDCPWVDKKFVGKEVEFVKSLDSKKRPIVVTESGEWSFWNRSATYADIIGVTMYKKVWISQIGRYATYPFLPIFYYRKAEIIRYLFGKEVIGVELQAEPWGQKLLYDSPLEEQRKTMNLEQFKYNINFARNSGFRENYLWGAEWWYWMKEKQNEPEIWNEAKKLFSSSEK